MIRKKEIIKFGLIVITVSFFLLLFWWFFDFIGIINNFPIFNNSNFLLSNSKNYYLTSDLNQPIEKNFFSKSDNFQIIDNRIYYHDIVNNQIKWYEDGDTGELIFTKSKGYLNFLLNQKEKIAWSDSSFNNILKNTNSALYSADIDGDDKKVLLKQELVGNRYLNPIFWKDENILVFTYKDNIEGELQNHIGSDQVQQINIINQETNTLFSQNDAKIFDINNKLEKLVFIKEIKNQYVLYLSDIGRAKNQEILKTKNNIISVKFSNRHCFFVSLSDNYIFIYNNNGEKKRELKNYQALEWYNNSKIIVKNVLEQKKGIELYDINSGELSHFSDYEFVTAENNF